VFIDFDRMGTYKNFPIPIVAFGRYFRGTDFERLQQNISTINELVQRVNTAVEKWSENVEQIRPYFQGPLNFLWVMGEGLGGPLTAGLTSTLCFVNILSKLVGQVDGLHTRLQAVEERIFNRILDGKLASLRGNLGNLENSATSNVQRVGELVQAFSNLQEILPIFSGADSIFRERFYVGAPLFVNFCVILKTLTLIALVTPNYNTSQLRALLDDYQNTLEWYKKRCIGSRMASCYATTTAWIRWNPGILLIDLIEAQCTWDSHYEKYRNKYYDQVPRLFNNQLYACGLNFNANFLINLVCPGIHTTLI